MILLDFAPALSLRIHWLYDWHRISALQCARCLPPGSSASQERPSRPQAEIAIVNHVQLKDRSDALYNSLLASGSQASFATFGQRLSLPVGEAGPRRGSPQEGAEICVYINTL